MAALGTGALRKGPCVTHLAAHEDACISFSRSLAPVNSRLLRRRRSAALLDARMNEGEAPDARLSGDFSWGHRVTLGKAASSPPCTGTKISSSSRKELLRRRLSYGRQACVRGIDRLFI